MGIFFGVVGPFLERGLGWRPLGFSGEALLGSLGEGLVAQILGIGLRAPQIFERKNEKKTKVCDWAFFFRPI